MVKKLAIANLNEMERQEILDYCNNNLPEKHKHVITELLNLIDHLLKESEISLHQLKQLLGFYSEKLKKEMKAQ